MNALKSLMRCGPATRQFTTSSVKRKRTFEEFKELQRQMQVDDDVPVHIKKGPIDKVILRTCILGVACVMAYSMAFLKKVIYPPPPS